MRDQESGTDKPTIIRCKLWRTETVVTLAVVIVLCVAPVIYTSGAAPLLAGPPFLLIALWVFSRLIQVQITESTVRIQQMRGGFLEVSRSEVRAIHFYRGQLIFQGPDREPVMEPVAQWSLKQMQEVADVLGVPLYDHRPRKLSSAGVHGIAQG
jgi:hypothetical protein